MCLRELSWASWTSALDALAAEDLHGLSDARVLDRTAMLVQLVNRATAELTRTVRHADRTQAAEYDGVKTVQSWLRGHGRLSAAAASRIVHAGRALEHLPAVAAGFASGEVTAEPLRQLLEEHVHPAKRSAC